ncbi:kyphoscoliosis peptidase-like [Conger conger]|uniref:kyphoscoliosis peptidase-like n=1 Tax=Conger conger TaxID=82655 RepID=UPI002A5A6414|nr:kyphoscoliosis peptidase-like [Conger conger]
MAFHNRLSCAQKILLAIFCFPLLPFYLCYAYCCATGDEDEKDNEIKEEHKLKHTVKAREDGQRDIEHQEEAVENGDSRKSVVTVEIHPEKNSRKLPARFSFGKGKDVRRNDIVYKNDAAVDIQPKRSSVQREHQEEAVENGDSRKSVVTVEIHPEKNSRKSPARFSFGKGKEVKRNDIVYKNEGFVDADKKKEIIRKNEYAYPWDKSSLKSMDIDLGKLKKLDAYSSKVRPRDTVQALVQELQKGASSDLEKLRAIWMWVTHHIEYDVEGLRNPGLRTGNADDVLKSGKGVCAGYAGLFQEMCRVAGIECETVSGHSKGAGYTLGKRFSGDGDHAWNAVRLGGRWHLLDSTWGAGTADEKFTFRYNEFYFLTHPALFAGDHFPEDAKWQMLAPRLSLKQYENMGHRKSAFYNLGLLSAEPTEFLIKSDGKTTITVQSSSPMLFLHDLNGKRECGIMTLKPYGMNLDVYPESTGLHTLEIYAKAGDAAEKENYSLVCSYQLQCRAVSREMRPPADLDNPVGPGWHSERKGLHEPSQRDPVVLTADGRCSFGFRVARGRELMAKLSAAGFSMTDEQQRRHVFLSRREDRTDFKVQVPRAGLYVLKVYAKERAEAGSYGYVCNYLISCADPRVRWPVYPLRYASWESEYELVEPLAGVLPANRTVRFRMRIPRVSLVAVGGGGDTRDLRLDADGYWTGSFNTAGCTDVNVMIKVNPNDKSRSFVLNYQVET